MQRLIDFIRQVIKYASTAIIGGIIDYGGLILLVEVFGVNYLIASVCSLTGAMIAQYILNIRFVFESGEGKHVQRFLGYGVLGIIGLGLNTLLLWIFASKFGLHYVLAKIIAGAFVGLYNFFSRKYYLENIDRVVKKALQRD